MDKVNNYRLDEGVDRNIYLKCKEDLVASLNLIREMGEMLNYAGQTLTVIGALYHRPPDEHLTSIKEILSRPEVRAIMSNNICKFGMGKQDMTTCRMIYIHISGYYGTEKEYQEALAQLCPNLCQKNEVY